MDILHVQKMGYIKDRVKTNSLLKGIGGSFALCMERERERERERQHQSREGGVNEGCFILSINASSYVNPKRIYGAGLLVHINLN